MRRWRGDGLLGALALCGKRGGNYERSEGVAMRRCPLLLAGLRDPIASTHTSPRTPIVAGLGVRNFGDRLDRLGREISRSTDAQRDSRGERE